MGNESKGLSSNIKEEHITKIKLPPYPAEAANMESLNVAVATALTVAEFRRRIY
jgi:TrmH family RNA methyltransferase